MNELVVMKDQQAVTSSLQVAETFNKNHRDVMKRVRDLTAQNIAVEKMFVQSTYMNKQGHQQPMYYMNRDGFTLLVVGFTGKKAMEFKLKYIEAFNQMEKQIRNYGGYKIPENMSEALQLAANQAKEMEVMRPKALFSDAITASKTSILVGELAKILKQNGIEIGQNRLFGWLRENGYLISRRGNDYNMPTQRSMNAGWFEIKESSHTDGNGNNIISKTPKVTGKGQKFFINKFLKVTN